MHLHALPALPVDERELCRYHTIARMIRAGYNVLSVHADSHFSDDPYVYVKRPPLNKATLVTMSHGGWTGLTSGFLYIQNAAIAGPVSWIFTETVDRASTGTHPQVSL